MTKTKFEVMAALNDVDVPCGPILSMKDIYEDKSLYERGYLVELDHPTRGRYVQVGIADQSVGFAGRGEAFAACSASTPTRSSAGSATATATSAALHEEGAV